MRVSRSTFPPSINNTFQYAQARGDHDGRPASGGPDRTPGVKGPVEGWPVRTPMRELSRRAFPDCDILVDDAPASIEQVRVRRRRQAAESEAAACAGLVRSGRPGPRAVRRACACAHPHPPAGWRAPAAEGAADRGVGPAEHPRPRRQCSCRTGRCTVVGHTCVSDWSFAVSAVPIQYLSGERRPGRHAVPSRQVWPRTPRPREERFPDSGDSAAGQPWSRTCR